MVWLYQSNLRSCASPCPSVCVCVCVCTIWLWYICIYMQVWRCGFLADWDRSVYANSWQRDAANVSFGCELKRLLARWEIIIGRRAFRKVFFFVWILKLTKKYVKDVTCEAMRWKRTTFHVHSICLMPVFKCAHSAKQIFHPHTNFKPTWCSLKRKFHVHQLLTSNWRGASTIVFVPQSFAHTHTHTHDNCNGRKLQLCWLRRCHQSHT